MNIGITQRVIEFRNGPYDSIDHGFYDMFAGHYLYPIPNNLEHFNPDAILKCDLIVFSGGNSMIPDNWQYNDTRLKIEKQTLDIAKLWNIPILGISRGTQFLTTQLGGDIKTNNNHGANHSICYNNRIISVHSRHDEVLNSIPNGATSLATDTEGYCESWCLDNIVTVLWHPERMKSHWLPNEAHTILGL